MPNLNANTLDDLATDVFEFIHTYCEGMYECPEFAVRQRLAGAAYWAIKELIDKEFSNDKNIH